MRNFCLLALLLLTATLIAAQSDDTLPPDSLTTDTLELAPPRDTTAPPPPPPAAPETPVQVAIEQIEITDMRLLDTLDVVLRAQGFPIAGFACKIAVDDRRVAITEVLPGALYDTCRWEYFTARTLETPGRENYPRQIWNAVALAQMIPDSVQPLCYSVAGEISLLRLVVSNEHMLETDDGIVPIFFFWESCSDNTLSDKSGNTLLMSRRVIDYSGAPPDSLTGALPSRTGAPRGCIDPAAHNVPKRLIDFHNGAIEFRLDLTLPPDTTTDTTAASPASPDSP